MSETKVRRSLSQVLPAAEELKRMLAPACVRIEIAGSLRRLRPTIADIELVCIPKIERQVQPVADLFEAKTGPPVDHNFLWAALDGLGDQVHWIKRGEKYRQFAYPLHLDGVSEISVDLFTANEKNWGLIYLIRTGSSVFSQHVVSYLAKNFRPSHAGYVRMGGRAPATIKGDGFPTWPDKAKDGMEIIPTPEEVDVFRLAGVRMLPPSERSW